MGPKKGVWLGVNPDLSIATVSSVAARLKHRPADVVTWAQIPLRPIDVVNSDAAEGQVRRNGGVMLMTLEPFEGLWKVDPIAIGEVVELLADYNADGVPVLLRFGHEMNGTWYPWGQDPTHYVDAFRAVARAVHAGAPCTAMVWAPNFGRGYPFSASGAAFRTGADAFAALDTNHDGKLDGYDDPYAPYYPGDAYVDWVGLSLYHWGTTYPWGANVLPEAGKFVQMMNGTYPAMPGVPAMPDFYRVYAVDHGKAFGIFETAALYSPDRDGATALDIKQAWWRQVFAADVPTRYPRLKLVNWFDWRKYENETHGIVDWSVTTDKSVLAAFIADLPTWAVFAAKPGRR